MRDKSDNNCEVRVWLQSFENEGSRVCFRLRAGRFGAGRVSAQIFLLNTRTDPTHTGLGIFKPNPLKKA
jgi:hypothetical protein